MSIPLPPQLREGVPQDTVTPRPVGRPPRRPSRRHRLAAAFVACVGSALLLGGVVGREAVGPRHAAGPRACETVATELSSAAPVKVTVYDAEARGVSVAVPRPPETETVGGRAAEGFRPDPFVPLPRD